VGRAIVSALITTQSGRFVFIEEPVDALSLDTFHTPANMGGLSFSAGVRA
jgi:hypothetical protein